MLVNVKFKMIVFSLLAFFIVILSGCNNDEGPSRENIRNALVRYTSEYITITSVDITPVFYEGGGYFSYNSGGNKPSMVKAWHVEGEYKSDKDFYRKVSYRKMKALPDSEEFLLWSKRVSADSAFHFSFDVKASKDVSNSLVFDFSGFSSSPRWPDGFMGDELTCFPEKKGTKTVIVNSSEFIQLRHDATRFVMDTNNECQILTLKEREILDEQKGKNRIDKNNQAVEMISTIRRDKASKLREIDEPLTFLRAVDISFDNKCS